MLIARIITATILLAACIGAMFLLAPFWWSALLLAILLAAGHEWSGLAGYSRSGRWVFCCALVLSAMAIGWAMAAGPMGVSGAGIERAVYGASCIFWVVAVPAWLARGWQVRGTLALAATGWIVLVPTWLALARLQADPAQLLQILGIVWLADIAAYATGRAWGRHKLAPRVSPGKTWEGVAGAAVAVAVYYVVLTAMAPAQPWAGGWAGMLIFAGVTAMSIVGDLFESLMKRQAGVKDSGALLPGHGGVLDRIDGLLAALPLAALLLRY
jgi:phosphatidate cytidylyltransferase